MITVATEDCGRHTATRSRRVMMVNLIVGNP